MIVVKLMGGVGNQMFQYALGRRLAAERSVPLRLDLSWFDESHNTVGDTVREYLLDGWRIDALKASEADLAQFPLSRSFVHRVSRQFPLFSRCVISEHSFPFDSRILDVAATTYLQGFWQSPKYFDPVRRMLCDEFSMREPPCPHVAALVEEARRMGTISVHVRRGDYVSNPETNAFHGVCSIDYYRKAVELLAGEVEQPRFMVFSDDLDWARENLNLEWPASFVEHDENCLPHNDIWLMCQCSHHVIANSSFSWWGAWLGTNPQKKVIAPVQWFRAPDIDTTDLFPMEWIRL